MISADDHENMAISDMQRDDNQAALVSAVLALAFAREPSRRGARVRRDCDRRSNPAATRIQEPIASSSPQRERLRPLPRGPPPQPPARGELHR